jgi:hypothetical protein
MEMVDEKSEKDYQLRCYDLTLRAEGVTVHDIRAALAGLSNKWVFQLENGTKRGFVHYQIRLSLNTKRRESAFVTLLQDTCLRDARVSRTSTEAFQRKKWTYVMKSDTRMEGPWTSEMADDEEQSLRPMLEKLVLRPFQKFIVDHCSKAVPNDREVNILFDPNGSIGKTILAKYLRFKQVATFVPAFTELQDISAMVISKPVSKAYVVDMPREFLGNSRNCGFWKGIEALKNGYVFDKRHFFRDRDMPSPLVWVFTNQFPDLSKMTADRWTIWMVDWNGILVHYTKERCDNISAAAEEDKQEKAAKRVVEPVECDRPRPKKQRVE